MMDIVGKVVTVMIIALQTVTMAKVENANNVVIRESAIVFADYVWLFIEILSNFYSEMK